MTTEMTQLKFSLSVDQFLVENEGQSFQIEKGLGFLQRKSMRAEVLDEYAIETLINYIEEILESVNITFHPAKIAFSSDVLLKQLSALFFAQQTSIDRILLESAFNAFVQRREYYVEQVNAEGGAGIECLVYFVFLREMMHHWNVEVMKFIEDLGELAV